MVPKIERMLSTTHQTRISKLLSGLWVFRKAWKIFLQLSAYQVQLVMEYRNETSTLLVYWATYAKDLVNRYNKPSNEVYRHFLTVLFSKITTISIHIQLKHEQRFTSPNPDNLWTAMTLFRIFEHGMLHVISSIKLSPKSNLQIFPKMTSKHLIKNSS